MLSLLGSIEPTFALYRACPGLGNECAVRVQPGGRAPPFRGSEALVLLSGARPVAVVSASVLPEYIVLHDIVLASPCDPYTPRTYLTAYAEGMGAHLIPALAPNQAERFGW